MLSPALLTGAVYPQGQAALQAGREDLLHLTPSSSPEPSHRFTHDLLCLKEAGKRSIPAEEKKGQDQEWASGEQPRGLEHECVRKAGPQLGGDSRDDDISTVQVPLQQSAKC